ncbi:hypothetical protein [Pseudalkalibacillus berkeleyi]|uniref:YesK-like protein n=1 Tax=Pseudalkalibacillus berkeleyi TaxID=1069813 RepID=A0ABS9H2H1_9BACL|nr:hypothetical protein [Pseudalkalibacillus berkeleyi]MCF6139152.1 hypothetical protein [Pseudalkalibacillus berkeleyi]
MANIDLLISLYILTFLIVFGISLVYVIKKEDVSVWLVCSTFLIEEAIVTAVFFKFAFPIGSGMFAIAWTYIGVIATVIGIIILLSIILYKKKEQ